MLTTWMAFVFLLGLSEVQAHTLTHSQVLHRLGVISEGKRPSVEIDLSVFDSPIKDQGDTNACTAYGIEK